MSGMPIHQQDALAVKKFSSVLFEEYRTRGWWARHLGGSGTVKTSGNAPVRFIDDIDDAGTRVSVDIIRHTKGTPIFGREVLAGKEDQLVFGSQDISIDQVRHGVDLGSRLDRRATIHDLRKFALMSEKEYWPRFEDQLLTIYATGVAPSATLNANFDILDSTFTGFAGNTLTAHHDGTDWKSDAIYLPASSSTAYSSSHVLTPYVCETISNTLLDMETPPPPIQEVDGEPLWVLLCDTKAIQQFRGTSTTTDTSWAQFAKYKQGMEGEVWKVAQMKWANLLLVPYNRIIRGLDPASGGSVNISYNLLLGKDALVMLRCKDPDTGNKMIWTEEIRDHKDKKAIGSGLIGGVQRTILNDVNVSHSCFVVPTYYNG